MQKLTCIIHIKNNVIALNNKYKQIFTEAEEIILGDSVFKWNENIKLFSPLKGYISYLTKSYSYDELISVISQLHEDEFDQINEFGIIKEISLHFNYSIKELKNKYNCLNNDDNLTFNEKIFIDFPGTISELAKKEIVKTKKSNSFASLDKRIFCFNEKDKRIGCIKWYEVDILGSIPFGIEITKKIIEVYENNIL